MHRFISVLVLAGIAPSVSCAPIRSVRDRFFKSRDERMAETITIHRDEWGVPHIMARTDAAAVFGMAYAQAEDNFWQVEEDLLRSLGSAASVYGNAALSQDIVRAAFEVERLSREEYAREPPARRALWDAYAGGLNYYLFTHPEVTPRRITRFEPWFVFARFRSVGPGTTIDSVPVSGVVATHLGSFPVPGSAAGELPTMPAPSQPVAAAEGSNAWAVAPSRTANGHALLFQNPHVGFFGSGQRWEVQLETEAGWHFSGFAILGTAMPRAGHNRHLGWTHTNTAADDADAWIVNFDHPTDSLAYRYAGDWRRAVEWEDTILVASAQGMEGRRYRFRKTHYGPVIRMADGRFASVRLARFEEGGSLQQWYAMGRAQSLAEFKTALAGTALSISNTMYADAQGNILYVHGNAVPRRGGAFDRTRPLDGANPETEWRGYHGLEELPQLLNPASGWLQNTNSTPFLATAEGANLKREDYPVYMAPEQDNERARASRLILENEQKWTFEAWARAAFDTRVHEAAAHIPAIIEEWERFGAREPGRALAVDRAVEALRTWDQISRTDSEASALFLLWLERFRRAGGAEGEWPRMRALEEVIASLKQWEAQPVTWGEINRLQRIHTNGGVPFDDNAMSLAVPGAPGWAGVIFAFTTTPGPSAKRRYGVSGHTWVGVVEFGPRPTARSVVPFGQSADPTSPHWFDQAALYVKGEFKQAWFWRQDVERQARRSYRPGPAIIEPAQGTAR